MQNGSLIPLRRTDILYLALLRLTHTEILLGVRLHRIDGEHCIGFHLQLCIQTLALGKLLLRTVDAVRQLGELHLTIHQTAHGGKNHRKHSESGEKTHRMQTRPGVFLDLFLRELNNIILLGFFRLLLSPGLKPGKIVRGVILRCHCAVPSLWVFQIRSPERTNLSMK